MTTTLVLILVFVLFVTLTIAVFLHNRSKELERTQQLETAAAQMGWIFCPTAPLNTFAGFERFTLFDQGHHHEIINLMYGKARGITAVVFDYIYVTGAGKTRQTHYQTVVYLEPSNLSVPYFSLRPETLGHKLLSAFGYQDIDFGQRSVFSGQYNLRGQDEPAIRRTFNDRLLAFYETYPILSTDAGGNQLFVFRGGYRFEPQEIQSWVGLALNILDLLPHNLTL